VPEGGAPNATRYVDAGALNGTVLDAPDGAMFELRALLADGGSIVLWRAAASSPPPTLPGGVFDLGGNFSVTSFQLVALTPAGGGSVDGFAGVSGSLSVSAAAPSGARALACSPVGSWGWPVAGACRMARSESASATPALADHTAAPPPGPPPNSQAQR